MASEVKLPRLGQGMESGMVTKWLKREGDAVRQGEPLFEVDTDKVTQEVESDFSGVLLKIALLEGEAPVGQTIGWIGDAGEEIAAPAVAPAADTPAPRAEEPVPGTAEQVPGTRVAAAGNGRVKASPLARRLARERGIDLAALQGTGPDGRIVARDVEGARARPSAPAFAAAGGEVERVPL